MDGPLRWVVAILVVAAIVGLVALARGEPEHGGPTTASVISIHEAV
jgi:hypothetical protein